MTLKQTELEEGHLIYEDDLKAAGHMDVRGGPCDLYGVGIDNTDAAAVYVKLYDNVLPTMGTTPPDFQFMVPASTKMHLTLNQGAGISFAHGLSIGASDTAGTVLGSDAGAAVKVDLTTS